MAKQTTSADELAIFALSKIYQRHTVIFNASKPWSTLKPGGEMLEEQLFENCQYISPTWEKTSMQLCTGNPSLSKQLLLR